MLPERFLEVFMGVKYLFFSVFCSLARCFIAAGIRPSDCCESKVTTAAVLPEPAANFPGSPFKPAGGQCLMLRALIVWSYDPPSRNIYLSEKSLSHRTILDTLL